MKYLPFENIIFDTKLSKSEIIKRLGDITEEERKFRFHFWPPKYKKAYQGLIGEHQFRLKRLISYENSFLPVITGDFFENGRELTVKIKMRLHSFVLAFLICWLTIAGFAFLGTLAFALVAKSPYLFLVPLFPFAMILFCYFLTTISFKYESNKSKKDLQKIFEGEIIEN